MNCRPSAFLFALAPLLLLATVGTPAKATSGPLVEEESIAGWICDEVDNICGLKDAGKLSNPARVNWPSLWDDTPEIKKMKDEGVNPDSPEGLRLQQKATQRLTRGCETERKAGAHCSVWKKIRHEDGRRVADLTEKVRKHL